VSFAILPEAEWKILMARLSIGDRVTDVSGAHDGKLVEIDGGTAYVMQSNGVEIEFPLDRLKLYEEPAAATSASSYGQSAGRSLNFVHRRLLASVPDEIRNAVAQSYEKGTESGPRQPFADLPDDRKLETIRIYLPSLPRHLLSANLKLVVAFRDIAKDIGPNSDMRNTRRA
jgi:hypothetical protein